MIAGTGKIINRSEISQSGGHALRVGLTNIATGNAPQFYVYPLDAEFSYTSIGTCASGRLRFADPVGWEPYAYLLRVQIYNNSTWETVFLSTHKGDVQQGNIYEVALVSIWEVVRGDFVDIEMLTSYGYPRIVGLAMDIPSVIGNMIIGGKMNSEIEIGYGMTWEQFFQTKYDEVSDAQWGYTPDNKFIAGRPRDFTALTYEHDGRTLEAESQGFSDLDYLTAYKGYNDNLQTVPTISESREIGSLIPRKTEVLSWDASSGDKKVEYTWTRQFPYNETLTSSDSYVQVEFGSNSAEFDTKTVAVRLNIDTNSILSSYDDITEISVYIKFSPTNQYKSQTFTYGAIGYLAYAPRNFPGVTWVYGIPWNTDLFRDSAMNIHMYAYPALLENPALWWTYYINSPTFNNSVPTYPTFEQEALGIIWNGNLADLRKTYRNFDNWQYLYSSGNNDIQYMDDTPDLRMYWAVGMSFDNLSAGGADITAEVKVSMTLRNDTAGWVIPPGFASEAYGGPAYRLFLNGLFAPPLIVDNGVLQQNLAGSTVRVTSAQGVTTEALTGVLPAGQSRRRR